MIKIQTFVVTIFLLATAPASSFDINPLSWFGVDKSTYETRLDETLYLFSLPKINSKKLESKSYISSIDTGSEFDKRRNNIKPLNSAYKDSWRYVYLKFNGKHGKGSWYYTNNNLTWYGLPDKLIEKQVQTSINKLSIFSYKPQAKELITHYIRSIKIFKFDY